MPWSSSPIQISQSQDKSCCCSFIIHSYPHSLLRLFIATKYISCLREQQKRETRSELVVSSSKTSTGIFAEQKGTFSYKRKAWMQVRRRVRVVLTGPPWLTQQWQCDRSGLELQSGPQGRHCCCFQWPMESRRVDSKWRSHPIEEKQKWPTVGRKHLHTSVDLDYQPHQRLKKDSGYRRNHSTVDELGSKTMERKNTSCLEHRYSKQEDNHNHSQMAKDSSMGKLEPWGK